MPDRATLIDLGAAAALTVAGAMAFAWAYARAEAQVLVPLEYSGFLWASLFGWLFFAEQLTLPTVIVDYTVGEDGLYDTLIEYTCKQELGKKVATELRFSSRGTELTIDRFNEMKAIAEYMGIPKDEIDALEVVDHSDCKEKHAETAYESQFLQ